MIEIANQHFMIGGDFEIQPNLPLKIIGLQEYWAIFLRFLWPNELAGRIELKFANLC
jgi:hypothetical protein